MRRCFWLCGGCESVCAAWINRPQMEKCPLYPGLIERGDKCSLFLCFAFFYLEDMENWMMEKEHYKAQQSCN